MLRERKRVATIRRVQAVAIDLFEARGFDAVTIEQVAEAAEVSPSTVYRYFGTKEGLVIHDEHDDELLALLTPELLRSADLFTAVEAGLRAITPEHFERDLELVKRRTRLWFEVPSVRAATYLQVDTLVDHVVAQAARPGSPVSEAQLRIVGSALTWGLVAALRGWYEEGMERPMLDVMLEALEFLRRAGSPGVTA
ncbi:MAG: TetR family transcriptional regulator [Dermatophilus congolensis]|nr:TetR family transcriptional regulator [Dermatophilus congolensis]